MQISFMPMFRVAHCLLQGWHWRRQHAAYNIAIIKKSAMEPLVYDPFPLITTLGQHLGLTSSLPTFGVLIVSCFVAAKWLMKCHVIHACLLVIYTIHTVCVSFIPLQNWETLEGCLHLCDRALSFSLLALGVRRTLLSRQWDTPLCSSLGIPAQDSDAPRLLCPGVEPPWNPHCPKSVTHPAMAQVPKQPWISRSTGL